eukprot:CAMPEP_0119472102 /NCGR_PEP_ID=MMETSP1344-20130328/4296_1 /TAXON_ID=236787 /ORGANISM="Florenciella parvula, Strain CCMP2471" /LENGTH=204 /DNA_ID=CAMNT_0007504999 /DNA_START=1446 /DNA_END=2060 /DNA_ORIENTATION=-
MPAKSSATLPPPLPPSPPVAVALMPPSLVGDASGENLSDSPSLPPPDAPPGPPAGLAPPVGGANSWPACSGLNQLGTLEIASRSADNSKLPLGTRMSPGGRGGDLTLTLTLASAAVSAAASEDREPWQRSDDHGSATTSSAASDQSCADSLDSAVVFAEIVPLSQVLLQKWICKWIVTMQTAVPVAPGASDLASVTVQLVSTEK